MLVRKDEQKEDEMGRKVGLYEKKERRNEEKIERR